MRLSAIERSGVTATFTATTTTTDRIVRFEGPDQVQVDLGADPLLAAGLLPAMRLGLPLELPGPVSSRLLAQASTIQDIILTWDRAMRRDDPWYHRIEVRAEARTPAEAEAAALPPGRGAACFFTGGVDSFHSAIAHRHELDALVYVHGFDVAIDDLALRDRVVDGVRKAAALLGLPLVEVATDVRVVGDGNGVGWEDYHGSALASVALLLAPEFSRFYLPATTTYALLYPLGSHPLLDPLWSTEHVEIVHDGADTTRLEKIAAIATEEAAQGYLRVCWENRGGAYNCGRCEKCVRTGVAIRIVGAEGRFRSLPPPSTRQIAAVRVPGTGSNWMAMRDELARTGANPRLRAALEAAMARHRARRWRQEHRWPS